MNEVRYRLLFFGLGAIVMVLLFRMFSLAYFDREFLQARGSAIAERTIDVPPIAELSTIERGNLWH